MKFDLIVIGAGSGLDISSAAAAKGMKVAIVEKGPMGGTCLNRGCIPSKILIHSADILKTIRESGKFGIEVGKIKIDFQKIMQHSFIVDQDSQKIEQAILSNPNLTLFKGEGKFVGHKILQIGDKQITADKIVIAAGTRPSIPPIENLNKVPYKTSDQMLRVEKLPKKLIIVGGGYIACELAHFFGTLGSEVTILQRNIRLLPNEDEEIGQKFTDIFSTQHKVKLGFPVLKVEKKGSKILVHGKDEIVEGTTFFIATGRTPNTDILDVIKTGVTTNSKGYIETNEFMETNVEGIWAIGDIVGKYLFKHSANLEAEYVSIAILNPEHKRPVDYTAMPHAVFSNPQIAGVGLTEQELREQGTDYLIGKYEYQHTGMGEALLEKNGFVKFITDYEGKILGCHIIGPEASTLIHEVLVSMKAGKSHVNDILHTIHIHPSLSEVVQRGAGSV
ncbi:MAG: dihydrolipoyl dehydrogenase [Candidatus Micrarchaeota archaeon]